MLRDPHPLVCHLDLGPGPLGEQGQILGRNAQDVTKACSVGAEVADEAQVAWANRGAEMQTEAGITRGHRSVLEECHVCGERDARTLAAQRCRVKPGAGEDSLR